jgi:hypothetical protein
MPGPGAGRTAHAVAAPRVTRSLRLAGRRPLLPRYRVRHRRSHPRHVGRGGRPPVDDVFRTCTIESLAAYRHPKVDLRAAGFTLYLGATYGKPVEGMFSFTPALPVTLATPGPHPTDRGGRADDADGDVARPGQEFGSA